MTVQSQKKKNLYYCSCRLVTICHNFFCVLQKHNLSLSFSLLNCYTLNDSFAFHGLLYGMSLFIFEGLSYICFLICNGYLCHSQSYHKSIPVCLSWHTLFLRTIYIYHNFIFFSYVSFVFYGSVPLCQTYLFYLLIYFYLNFILHLFSVFLI